MEKARSATKRGASKRKRRATSTEARLRAIIRATLADTPLPELESELVKRLLAAFDERAPERFPEPTEESDERVARRLKALGL